MNLFKNAKKPREKGVTCAVVIIDQDDNVLLAHPTGSKHVGGWSLPKGLRDPHETESEAACREVLEETGLRITPEVLTDHGRFPYTAEKDYHIFSCRVSVPINTKTLVCESTFLRGEEEIPEVDRYQVVPMDQALIYLNPRQAAIVEVVKDKLLVNVRPIAGLQA